MTHIPTTDQLEISISDGFGVCTSCGEMTAEVVERDAKNLPCEHCNENAVYGASEMVFMGEVK
jgi:hypothetical protein